MKKFGEIKKLNSFYSTAILYDYGTAYVQIACCGFRFEFRFFSDTNIDELNLTINFVTQIREIIEFDDGNGNLQFFDAAFIRRFPFVESISFLGATSSNFDKIEKNIISVKIK